MRGKTDSINLIAISMTLLLIFTINVININVEGRELDHNKRGRIFSPYVIVDSSGSGDFDDIQNGLDAVSDNGTLLIMNGVYTGQFYVNRSVRIIGESMDGVTIQPSMINRTSVFDIEASHIHFSNLTIIGYKGISSINHQTGIRFFDEVMDINIKHVNFTRLQSTIYLFGKFDSFILSNISTDSGLLMSTSVEIKDIIIVNSQFIGGYMFENIFQNTYFQITWRHKSILIRNSTFLNNWKISIPLIDNGKVENNKFINNATNVLSGGIIGLDSGIVSNNSFSNISNPIGISLNNGDCNVNNNSFENIEKAIYVYTNENPCEIKDNIFNNCTNGIVLRGDINVNIRGNEFHDAGIEFDDRSEWVYRDIEIQENNIDDKPIVFYKDVNDLDSFSEFGQLLMVNCDRFDIENMEIRGGEHYPLISAINSNYGVIKSNEIYGGDSSIWLSNCIGTIVTNNSFDENSDMTLSSCTGSDIYYNTFGASNESFFDDGSNSWSYSGFGNFWKGLNLPDSNNDGISEIDVWIPGGGNIDRNPLVPGVVLDWDQMFDVATTGEDAPIKIFARNNIFKVLSNLSLEFGNETARYTEVFLGIENEEHIYYINIPTNSTDNITLAISARDILGNNYSIGPITIEVQDNDKPEIELIHHEDKLARGILTNTFISARDNIRVTEAWAIIDDNADQTISLIYSESMWKLNSSTEDLVLGDHSITIYCSDGSDNIASISLNLTITDGSPPLITRDLSYSKAYTGSRYHIIIIAKDQSGISNVNANIKQVKYSDEIELLPITPEELMEMSLDWTPSEIDLENDEYLYFGSLTVPVDDDSQLIYRITLSDTLTNTISSEETRVEVIDDIAPTVNVYFEINQTETGELIQFDLQMNDNIKIHSSWVHFFIDGEIYKNETGQERILFEVPNDRIGDLSFTVFVFDLSGNIGTYESISVPIVDNIHPTCTIDGVFKGNIGDILHFKVNATDNVGVKSIHWSIGDSSGEGIEIEFSINKKGEYHLSIEVTDSSNNKYYSNWTITIEDSNETSDGYGNLLMIIIMISISVIIIAIIAMIWIFLAKKRSEDISEKQYVNNGSQNVEEPESQTVHDEIFNEKEE